MSRLFWSILVGQQFIAVRKCQHSSRTPSGTSVMAMVLMLCMFVLFLVFSGLGLYMMFKTSFLATAEDLDDMPPDM